MVKPGDTNGDSACSLPGCAELYAARERRGEVPGSPACPEAAKLTEGTRLQPEVV
jgi:hypothetical protein